LKTNSLKKINNNNNNYYYYFYINFGIICTYSIFLYNLVIRHRKERTGNKGAHVLKDAREEELRPIYLHGSSENVIES
jgi:hypothetical protein